MEKIPLTDQEYQFVHQIVQGLPAGSRSVRVAHGQIIRQNGQFRRFGGWKNLNDAYKNKRDTEIHIQKIDNDDAQQKFTDMALNPNNFLVHNSHPMYESRKHLPWTQKENETLNSVVANAGSKKTDWSLLSLSIPGRSGHSIHQHYNEMISKNGAECESNVTTQTNPFGDITKMTFLPCYEEILCSFIEASFYEGIQMDMEFIKDEAREFYYTSYVIAERITYEIFSRKKKQIYTDAQKNTYTDDFTNECRQREIRFENSIHYMIQEIEESGLTEPVFSDHWVRNFMDRNRLSFRHAHFRRRGIIDETEVETFVSSVVTAINTYGWQLVFNMDETSVMINNGSNKTIAPVGIDEIIITGDKNEKECFTCIGSCSRLKKYDLIVLGVGTTDQCCRKFGTHAMAWPSLGGWVDELTMVRYLNWFHSNVSSGNQCALILDQYPSHCTPLVKEVAQQFNIQLIYIPKNATGVFQPLDRRIFGIIKTKLRCRSKAKIYSGHERFEIIFEMLMKSWGEITNDHLESAWNIPQVIDIINAQ